MYRIKRVISLLLCGILFLTIGVQGSFFGYEGLSETYGVELTDITFTDAVSGKVITSLEKGTTVKATAKVKKSEKGSDKVSLVLSLFSGGEYIHSTTAFADLSSGVEKEVSNTISIPDISGLTLEAYIWDGVNTSVPLASKAVSGSDNIDVEAILVDGKTIEGFSNDVTEYTVTLDPEYNEYPTITVRALDSSAKIDITELYSFTSSVKQIAAKITSQSGVKSKTFIITFKQEKPVVSNIVLNNVSATCNTDVLSEPVWTENPPTAAPVNNGTTNYTSSNLPSESTGIYTDKEDYYISISPEIKDGTVISFPSSLKDVANATDSTNTKLVSFDINHTADVYVAVYSDTSYTQLSNAGFSFAGVKAYRISPSSSSYVYGGVNFFKRSYNVEKGKTTRVEIPYTKSSAMYSVVVKFTDGKSRISNAKYTYKSGSSVSVETNKYYEPVTAYGAPSNVYSCLFKTECFSDNAYHTMYMLPKEAQGADALVLPMYLGSKNIQKISFTLNRTGTVYFCWRDIDNNTTIDNMTELGNQGYTRFSNKVQYRILSTNGVHSFPASGGIFKKDYYLKPGETKEIVFDGIPVSSQAIGYIFVTDIDYDYYNHEGNINIEPDNSFVFEAEAAPAKINSPFAKTNKASSPCVAVSSSAVVNNSGTPVYDDNSALIYPISVEENGNYYIWMKIYAPDTGADSFFLKIDDDTPMLVSPPYKEEWQWMLVKTQHLTRGTHKLKIYHRERNIGFDKLAISKQTNYTPDDFSWSAESYNPGDIKPPANTHPRLFFTSKDIPSIKANLTHEQNISSYNKLVKDAGYNTNGYLSEYEALTGTNADMQTISAAGNCAFLYAINNDTKAGEKAVRILGNIVDTLSTKGGNVTYISRHIGHTLFNCALVYDWCYDIIDAETKEKFIGLFYIMASQLETGWPPVKMNIVQGHALEGELLKDYLACGIAVYDEDPGIYNNVAGRIINDIVPIKNHYSTSMQLFEGATYGPYREFFTMMSAYMFKAIGYPEIYNPIQYQLYGMFYNKKPDGRFISTGDDANEEVWGYTDSFSSCLFLAGNFYKDPYLKREYMRSSHMGNTVINDAGMVTPLIHLITNDVSVKADGTFRELPLTAFYNYPSGVMSARTSWNEGKDSDTLHVQMNIQEQYYGGHQHLDSGHFDIYYKGTLAVDSGIYESAAWKDANGNTVTNLAHGSVHDFGYHKRTIAHNSLLVYNPGESAINSYFSNADGGQTGKYEAGMVNSAAKLNDGTADVGYVVSYDFGENLYAPEYSYLKGNLTEGYGSKVSNFTRSFMFLNFKDEKYPGALIVYDNVTAPKALFSSYSSYKKTWLLHSQEEPVISGAVTTITATTLPGNNGRLINNTLLPSNAVITKVGGEGNEFTVNGTNYTAVPKSSYNEYGVWRVEVSGKNVSTNRYNANEEFLNVMQMSENSENIAPLDVKLITSVSGYNGVKIKDRVVYLKKAEALSSSALTLAATDSEAMQIIDGLSPGVWSVKNSSGTVVATKNVYEGHNTLSFTAPAGTYTLTRTATTNTETKDYSILERKNPSGNLPIDVKIHNIYESFNTAEPYVSDGNIYLPAEELGNKLGKTYSYSGGSLKLNSVTIPSGYVNEKNGIVYVAVNKAYSSLGISVEWSEHSRILFIK